MNKILASVVNNLKIVIQIIPHKLKKEYLLIVFLSFGLAIVEFLGISFLIPFFNEISETDGPTYLQIFNLIFGAKLLLTAQQSIIFSVTVVLILLSIKNLISVFVVFKQFKFGSKIQATISEGLFSTYLRKPYSDIVGLNSSDLIRNAIPETNRLNESVIVPSFFLITDFVLVSAIVLFLLISEPLSSLILFSILGFFYAIPIYFFGRRLTAWGKERFVVEGERVKLLQEGLGAFVEIKLRSSWDSYIRKYKGVNDRSARFGYLLNSNLQIPKLALEVFIFLSLLIMILVNTIFLDYSNKDLLKILGLFAISAYKLLPTLGRITNTIQTIRFYKPSMDVFVGIGEGIEHSSPVPGTPKFSFSSEIHIKDLGLAFNDKSLLNDIDFSIYKGETIGIIGKSGSGKTSLAYCILGLTKPTTGSIMVDESDIYEDIHTWRSMIGYVPQAVFLLDDSIENNITLSFESTAIDPERLRLSIEQAGLTDWVRSLPQGLSTRVGERGSQISGGQLQRIGIARALYKDPEILVFDESTSALDPNTEEQFLSTIESLKSQKTILFITHKKAPLKICSRILKIEDGSIIISQKNNVTS